MRKVKIYVTAEDIDSARKAMKRAGYVITKVCPVARAVRRAMKSRSWEVGVYSAWQKQDDGLLVDLPKRAINFISKFDSTDIARPFSFVLSLPAA